MLFTLLILQVSPLHVYGSTELSIDQVLVSPGFYAGSSVSFEGYVGGGFRKHHFDRTREDLLRKGLRRADVVRLVDPTGTIEIYTPDAVDTFNDGYPWKQGMYVRVEGEYDGGLGAVIFTGSSRPWKIYQVEPPCLPSSTIQNEEFHNYNAHSCRK